MAMCTDCLKSFDTGMLCDLALELEDAAHTSLPPGCNWCVWEIVAHCEGRLSLELEDERKRSGTQEAKWTWLFILLLIALLGCVLCAVLYAYHEMKSNKAEKEHEEVLLENTHLPVYNIATVFKKDAVRPPAPTKDPEDTPEMVKRFPTMGNVLIYSFDRRPESEVVFEKGDIVEVRHDVYDAENKWTLAVVVKTDPETRVRHLNHQGAEQHFLKFTSIRYPSQKAIHKLRRSTSRPMFATQSSFAFSSSEIEGSETSTVKPKKPNRVSQKAVLRNPKSSFVNDTQSRHSLSYVPANRAGARLAANRMASSEPSISKHGAKPRKVRSEKVIRVPVNRERSPSRMSMSVYE